MNGPYREGHELTAARLVPVPRRSRQAAKLLAVSFVGFLLFVILSPWQQNVSGSGRIIAFTPLERQQNIDAPVTGRVVQWFVQEGDRVAEGDPIVEISDNDPLLMERLNFQRSALAERLRAVEARVISYRANLESQITAREGAVQAAQARVRVAEQGVRSAEQSAQAARAALDTALLNLARQDALAEEGLASQREAELARLREAETRTQHEAAQADVVAARSSQAATRAELTRVEATTAASIETARALLQSGEGDVASAKAALADIDVRIARQEAQLIPAPRDGTVFRLIARQGGEQVSAGSPLAILVPETRDRAVELWVDGNDASLIREGRKVRLQFEGWPAVQFSGWPSVAVGTFGGVVAFVDVTDDGRGDFRVVVRPDPEDQEWPGPTYLRQGIRANGWVLLDTVSVGFEMWRQLNGFPPVVDPPRSEVNGAHTTSDRPPAGGY